MLKTKETGVTGKAVVEGQWQAMPGCEADLLEPLPGGLALLIFLGCGVT